MDKRKLITDLQSQGLKLLDLNTGRKGGAGPSDHKAVTINDTTVMIPIHNSIAAQSEYTLADFHEQSVNYQKSYVIEKEGEGILIIGNHFHIDIRGSWL